MARTRAGYTGGRKPRPAYVSLGDHAEAVEMDFDPGVIGYNELLDIFWASHDPARPAPSRQYMSAVFYHDDRQKEAALRGRDREAARRGVPLHTLVAPAERFYRAEGYHQKYYLRRHRGLMKALAALYPDPRQLADSTAAARLNGCLGGHGDPGGLEGLIAALGLSPEALGRGRPAWKLGVEHASPPGLT